MLMEDFKKLAIGATLVIIVTVAFGTIILLPKSSDPQTAIFDNFLVGTGSGSLTNLQNLNYNYSMNMNLMTSWISSRDELYGWWSSYYSPEPLWTKRVVPHLITYQYFQGS